MALWPAVTDGFSWGMLWAVMGLTEKELFMVILNLLKMAIGSLAVISATLC